jgi:hypothetical protein
VTDGDRLQVPLELEQCLPVRLQLLHS